MTRRIHLSMVLAVAVFFTSASFGVVHDEKKKHHSAANHDGIELRTELVAGAKITETLANEALAFVTSPEGRQFIQDHKQQMLYGPKPDFRAEFTKALQKWSKNPEVTKLKNGMEKLASAMKFFAGEDSKLSLHIFYPSSTVNATFKQIADEIANQLSYDIAFKIRGRNGPITNVISNAIGRASRDRAILGRVQDLYDQEVANQIADLKGEVKGSFEGIFSDAFKTVNLTAEAEFHPMQSSQSADSYVVLSKSVGGSKTERLASWELQKADELTADLAKTLVSKIK